MPTMTADERRAADKAENIGWVLCDRVVDDLKADPRRARGSRVWKLDRDLLVRAVVMHCVMGANCEEIYDELSPEFKGPKGGAIKVPKTNFRRWMAHAAKIYNELRKQGWVESIKSDYVPADGHVDVMAQSLGQSLFSHAMFLLKGGANGEPPTEKELALIIRAQEQLNDMLSAQASADRQRAQAQLDRMKADKLKRSLTATFESSPQRSFTAAEISRVIDGVLAGGVEVEEKIKSKAGASGGRS